MRGDFPNAPSLIRECPYRSTPTRRDKQGAEAGESREVVPGESRSEEKEPEREHFGRK